MTNSTLSINNRLLHKSLGWLNELEGAELYHTDLACEAYGRKRHDEIVSWMTMASPYPRWLVEILLDDCLAYKKGRASLPDINDPLVIALLPDWAYHLFLINTAENRAVDKILVGGPIDHDTADDTAPLGNAMQMAHTLTLFHKNGIGHHDLLWQDDTRFPNGVELIPSWIKVR